LVKVGIIIDQIHLETKVSEFLKYLRSKVKVSLYIEERSLFKYSDINFDEDIFFVKGKGDVIMGIVKMIENETSIPVINSYRGIWNAFNRFINCILLKKAGIPIPKFTLCPETIPPQFNDFISKNLIDQKSYAFQPKIEKVDGHLQVQDKRAINEKDLYDNYFFFQEFIKSKWEYKIYCIGEDLFFYKQLPVLVNPNKMKSRQEIKEIPLLGEMVIKAKETLDLEISSVDFLKSKDGQYYLTDINSSPNFNYIKNGPQIVGDYLIKQAKR